MRDEIRQNGKVVLKSEDGVSIPMFFNNLCGKNFSGTQYRDYIRNIALGEMGFKSGRPGRNIAKGGRNTETLNRKTTPKNQQREIHN